MADNPAYTPIIPVYVVVDTLDGYVFSHDSNGDGFTQETASEFEDNRNKALKPGYQSYKVFSLTLVETPVKEPVKDV